MTSFPFWVWHFRMGVVNFRPPDALWGAWSSAPPLPLSLTPLGKEGGTWIGKRSDFPAKILLLPNIPFLLLLPFLFSGALPFLFSGAGWLDLRSNNTFFILPPSLASRAGTCRNPLCEANPIVVCE